jgi:hypothetical protein
MIDFKVSVTVGRGSTKRELVKDITMPESIREAIEVEGGSEAGVVLMYQCALVENTREVLRKSVTITKLEALYKRTVEALIGAGINQEEAEKSAKEITGFPVEKRVRKKKEEEGKKEKKKKK